MKVPPDTCPRGHIFAGEADGYLGAEGFPRLKRESVAVSMGQAEEADARVIRRAGGVNPQSVGMGD